MGQTGAKGHTTMSPYCAFASQLHVGLAAPLHLCPTPALSQLLLHRIVFGQL